MENLKNKKILVVDDEEFLRDFIASEFQDWGCQVFQAPNGREAFKMVLAEKVDAVISDIRMRGGDGIELMHRIKGLREARPVLFLITGFSDLSEEDAYEDGAERVILKPFDIRDLFERVDRSLMPLEDRWSRPSGRPQETQSPVRVIRSRFLSLGEASSQGLFRLGRGGAFIAQKDEFPHRGDRIGLEIEFGTGPLKLLSGIGTVLWVRLHAEEGLRPGIGVEFESFSRSSLDQLLPHLRSCWIPSYIPKA